MQTADVQYPITIISAVYEQAGFVSIEWVSDPNPSGIGFLLQVAGTDGGGRRSQEFLIFDSQTVRCDAPYRFRVGGSYEARLFGLANTGVQDSWSSEWQPISTQNVA